MSNSKKVTPCANLDTPVRKDGIGKETGRLVVVPYTYTVVLGPSSVCVHGTVPSLSYVGSLSLFVVPVSVPVPSLPIQTYLPGFIPLASLPSGSVMISLQEFKGFNLVSESDNESFSRSSSFSLIKGVLSHAK